MKELKGKTIGELGGLLAEKREELRLFRFAVSGGKTKNVKSCLDIRKSIARILTEINSKKVK